LRAPREALRDRVERLRAPLRNGAALAVLGFRAADPNGYGRLLVEGDRLVAIREQADASTAILTTTP